MQAIVVCGRVLWLWLWLWQCGKQRVQSGRFSAPAIGQPVRGGDPLQRRNLGCDFPGPQHTSARPLCAFSLLRSRYGQAYLSFTNSCTDIRNHAWALDPSPADLHAVQVHALCQSKSPSPRPLITARCSALSESPEARGGRLQLTHTSITRRSRVARGLGCTCCPKQTVANLQWTGERRDDRPCPGSPRARSRVVPSPPVVCAYLKHASVDSCNPAVPRRSTSQAHTNQPPAVAIDEPESSNWAMCNTHASDTIFAHQQIKPLCSTSRGP